MKTVELFQKKQVLSFEVFPPKRTAPVNTIYETLEELKSLHPDFISVTYGAGGTKNCESTLEIASAIKHQYGVESVAHLPCCGLSREEICDQLKRFEQAGIKNILALRGDISPGTMGHGDFRYASDLIELIKVEGEFNIIAACYPEGHTESENIVKDIQNLKRKVDAGASHLISQLFFDNDCFYHFCERAEIAGIHVPIEAGIMPVVNKKQIERMVSLCGATLPEKFVKMMSRYEYDSEAMRDAGIAYAVNQIVDLVTQGVDGIHLYTMNNPYIAKRIYEATHRLFAPSGSSDIK